MVCLRHSSRGLISHSAHAPSVSLQLEPYISTERAQSKISTSVLLLPPLTSFPLFSLPHTLILYCPEHEGGEEGGGGTLILPLPLFDFELMYTMLKLTKTEVFFHFSEARLLIFLRDCWMAEHVSSLPNVFDFQTRLEVAASRGICLIFYMVARG